MAGRHIAPQIGVGAGLITGLFGVGGGIVVVPGLVLALGFGQRQASGTSMATMIVSTAAALIVFTIEGAVDFGAAALLGLGAVVGAWLGARFLHLIPERWLSRAFVVLLLAAAARMALG